MRLPASGIVRFRETIRILGVNPYVKVSALRARRLRPDWRRPMPVRVRINGHPDRIPWKINLMPAGNGTFLLYLHGTVRSAAKVGVGDRVEVQVQFDRAYRPGPSQFQPRALTAALARDAKARAGWKALTPSRQKEIARYLANLKTPAALKRNVARTLEMLGGKGGRFMARDW